MLQTPENDATPTDGRSLPLLLLLFVGSGCAALIYEIVWFQLLQLVIGSSAYSLGVLLGTFMGGMCLGSLLLPKYVTRAEHPLRAYAKLELGIGALGIVVLFLVPLIGRLYVGVAGGTVDLLFRAVVAGICLLPPTLLMGATLPAIARWVESTPKGVSWLGFFYGSNIAGAVFGCLLAGFYLLRVTDMRITTFVAVAINVAVAVAALALAGRSSYAPESVDDAKDAAAPPMDRAVLVTIALSGMSALGAEVVWTRLLSLMLGATVYTFSIILAVVLLGLGIGSSIGSALSRGTMRPKVALGVAQLLVAFAVTWTSLNISDSLPFWPVNPALLTNPWIFFQFDIARCVWALLPACILWGASFPLALAASARSGADSGALVGKVYAANTVGAILGALLFSIGLVPWKGTQFAQQAIIVLAVISALIVLIPALFGDAAVAPAPGAKAGVQPRRSSPLGAIGLGAALLLSLWCVKSVHKVPDGLVGYGRYLPTYSTLPSFLYVGEGINSTVAVSELANGDRNFHVAGKIEASTEPQDMRLQRMLGHLSALATPKPKSVLIVGFGAGVTAGSFVTYPEIERIVICELEPLIPTNVGPYFEKQNYNVAHDPRVQIVYDDARHFVLTTKEKFDVITSDPIHPWVKGAATLYTKEYFEMVKAHLKPGGVISQWVPMYESHSAAVESQIATFMDVFPNGTVWGNTQNGRGYDLVLLGTNGPTVIDIDSMNVRMGNPAHGRAIESLREVGFGSSIDLFATYAAQGSDLKSWLTNAQINRDVDLRLQYIAGLGNNSYENGQIYDGILRARKYPEKLFVAKDEWKNALASALGVTR
jgi:spermidine synthase